MITMKSMLLLNFLWFVSGVIAYSPEENQYTRDNQLVEGDIKFLPSQMRGARSASLWPNGVFVYDIESSLDHSNAKEGIAGAMRAWNENTKGCIKFKKRTSETAYVSFFRGNGCWSYVGRIGTKQQISLDFGCWRNGTIAHEIGHALGFLHEQSRPDRDDYVEIKFENIRSGAEGNFRKSHSDNSMGTPYDYGSIMHYGERFFSRNSKPTIVPKIEGVHIGNRAELSDIDVDQMMKLYGCTSVPTHPPVQGISFQCSFDNNMCGFNHENDDKFDWTRRSIPTPSGGTGPEADHTGGGSFMYIEASRPRRRGDNAKLARMVTLSGKSCLRFYYHMYGNSMGTLKVKLVNKVIFEESGNHGNQWNMKDIPLEGSGSKKLTFEGIRGGGYTGDAAIDDITIYDCQ